MNWRKMLYLFTAKVAEECGHTYLADTLRANAPLIPVMDGGGFHIITGWGADAKLGRCLQSLPAEVDGDADMVSIAFIAGVPATRHEKIEIVRRLQLPAWARD